MLWAMANTNWGDLSHFRGLRGRNRRKWEDNIKMDLQKFGWGGMDRIDLAQDRDRWWAVVYAAMNFQVPYNAETFLTNCRTVSLSGTTLLHGVIYLFIYLLSY
jgi:hypothetical protein